MHDFEQKLDRYADLLVSYAMNVQKGQMVFISGEPIHRKLAVKMGKIAYEKGAKAVHMDLQPPELLKERLLLSEESNLSFVPHCVVARYDEMVDEEAAIFRFQGSEFPDILDGVDPKKANKQQLSFRKAIKRYFDEGVGLSKMAWTIGAHATPNWGKRLFPELEPEEACLKLWDEIFKICRVDKPNTIELWKTHNNKLKERAKLLTELKIETLHFKGPGTDLKVSLSPLAQFRGGGGLSSRNIPFEPNIPTEECFTTPDCRRTEGKARVTRPFLVNGKLIEGLELEFKAGEIVHFTAQKGKESFAEYIACDPGAKRLGEVALVGIDSPVYQSGIVFQEILYDENAACHIAVGFAYPFCVNGGEKMSSEEKQQNGVNESACHLDMMISNDEVDVIALTYDHKEVPLIKKGEFVL